MAKNGSLQHFFGAGFSGLYITNLRCSRCHSTNLFEIKEHSQSRNTEGMWFCSMYYTDCLNIRILERLCVVAIMSNVGSKARVCLWHSWIPSLQQVRKQHRKFRPVNGSTRIPVFFSTFLYKLFLESKIFLQGKKVVARFGVHLFGIPCST